MGQSESDKSAWAIAYDPQEMTHFIVQSGDTPVTHYKVYKKERFLKIYNGDREEFLKYHEVANRGDGGVNVFTVNFGQDGVWMKRFDQLQ